MSSYSDYGNAVSQLLVGKGAAQARATENTGNLWGGAVSSIGPLALQIPQIHAQQTELKQRQQVLDANQRRVTREEAAQAALNNAFTHGADAKGVIELLKGTEAAYKIPDVEAAFQETEAKGVLLGKARQEVARLEGEHMYDIGRTAKTVQHPADQAGLLITALAHGVKVGAISKEHAAQAGAGLLNEDGVPDPQRVAQTINFLMSQGQPGKEDKPSAPTETTLAVDAFDPTSPTAARSKAALDRLKPPPESKPPSPPTETTLAMDAATVGTPTETPTAKQAAAALRILRPPKEGGAGALTPDASAKRQDAKVVAQGIKQFVDTGEGLSPEILLSTRTTEQGMALNAELQRMGVDTAKLTREWTATKGAIRSLDSAQQIKLSEAINKASASLDKVEELNTQWEALAPRVGIKLLNHASLRAAQNGAYGAEAASVAQNLEQQIADVTGEISQAIMGGNSPTNEAFKLASKNLSGNWTQKVLSDSIKLARYNLNRAQMARNELLEQLGVKSTQFQTPEAGASTAAPVVPRVYYDKDGKPVAR